MSAAKTVANKDESAVDKTEAPEEPAKNAPPPDTNSTNSAGAEKKKEERGTASQVYT